MNTTMMNKSPKPPTIRDSSDENPMNNSGAKAETAADRGIKLIETNDGQLLEVHVQGRLTHEDYQRFVPEFERLIRAHGKIRVLFEMSQFHGWEARAIWDDIKFDLKHFKDIERLAMVGERKWEQWMAGFCKPFTTATIRYFNHEQTEAARAWLDE